MNAQRNPTPSTNLPTPLPGLIDRADSILLIIDLQAGFLNNLTPERREAIIDRCRFLVEVATRLGIPKFATLEDPAKNGMTTERVLACFEPDLPQRDKRFFGLCGQSNLREAILAQPKRTAILVGMDTDCCVLQSAVGLRGEGFRSIIVSDATEAPGLARDQGLARAQTLGVELVATRALYYEWLRSLDDWAVATAAPAIAAPAGMIA